MRVTRNLCGHSDKHFIYCTGKKDPAGENFGFLLPEKLKNCILNEKLNPSFFYQRFLSRTLTTHRTAGEGRGPSFIPLYHFHPLTNIQTFATLHVRWLSHIFNRTACIYQTATRWDLPAYRITIWLIDVMLIFVCLLVDLNLGFVIVIWHEKPVDSNSHRLSFLYYKQTD